ncbi:TonB-dependent siderophore receptor [Rheinheimera sp. 1928-s]|uniref:TonB-dependent siderophore receptor n=1 Tax=Rheinheimera sp. 1928-s TaxID=3033803 RepID=UPI00262C0719|nr:TonB-dependent siderophore receptor [Rheinheimera sp. 1928-s]MDF3125040.1 TonB-dependent siderophore receptor [Rheinheimera sp. 1928-s]
MALQQKFRKLPVVLAVQLACMVTVVHAADEKAEKDIEKITVKGHYTVNENIDTATGLGLSLFETPQSVSVITSQRIIDQGFSGINEVISQTVGVSAKQLDTTRNTFSARGFDIDKYQIDGVPLAWSLAGDSGETITDVSIYERIEVVRGATGLLTGAGDPSASINLVRKHADSAELTGYVNAGIGRWNNRFITADLSTGLDAEGDLRVRFVAKKEVGDSFMDIPEDDKTVLYGVVDADLTDNTSVSFGSSYQDNDPKGSTWGGLAAWFSDGTATNWDRNITSAADWTYWASTNENTFVNLVHNFANGWQAKVSFNSTKNTADTQLLYLVGSPDKETGLGLSPWPYKSSGTSEQDSLDLQLKGDYQLLGQSHEFVVGVLNSKQEAETVTFGVLSADTSVGNFYQWNGKSYSEPVWSTTSAVAVDLETEQDGYYAATRFSLTDDLKLIAGGRLSKWERTGVNYGVPENFGDDSVFVPYAGLMYQLSANHNAYISQTEIFKPQNARVASGAFIDPLEGTNTELGLKSSFLDGAVQTAVAVFKVDQDNLAQPIGTFPQVDGRPLETMYRAAQGVESKGFEVELIGRLTDSWNISAGYSQFKAEDAAGVEVNTDHPRKKLNLFTTYDFVNELEGLVIGGGISWEDEQYSGTAPKILRQDSYSLVSLMARYDVTEQFSVQFNVDNLFDETYYSQIGFFDQYGYGTPRNFTLGATYSF